MIEKKKIFNRATTHAYATISKQKELEKKIKFEMNNFNEVKERYNQIYPSFGSYTECMSRALMTGSSASVLGNI